jgi:hypothetical protein
LKLPKASAIVFFVVAAGFLAASAAPALDLTREELTLLAQNPALAELAAEAPDALTQVFEMIVEAGKTPPNDKRGFEGLDPVDAQLLGDNPALLQVWQSSPEASADLLALIKSAAGGGGRPTK